MNWTDQEVDSLLASVEETLVKVDALAKSTPLKKDEDGKDKDKPAPDAAPAQDAPPAAAPPADAGAVDASAAPAPAADAGAAAPPADAQAADAAAAPAAEGDQALEGEQDQDAPLSDEELTQIYSSMAPDELERHYSIIRQALQAAYGSQDAGAAPAPAPAADAGAAPAPEAAPAPDMQKSEEIADLKKQVAELAAANEQIVKAFEVLTKPSRKSITEIQVMQKSEGDNGQSNEPMTAEQTKEAARKLNPAALTKGERDMVNQFYLEGVGQKEVEKLIHSKGGK